MANNKKFKPAWLLAIFVPLFIIIGVSVFLGSKDCDTCLTGWAVLKLEWPSFWRFAIFGIILGIVALYLAYANESGNGAVGRKLHGNTGFTILMIILAIAFMAGPWGKACTDKANQGVTAPGYKSDSTDIKQTSLKDTSAPFQIFMKPHGYNWNIKSTRYYLLVCRYGKDVLHFDSTNLKFGENKRFVEYFYNGGKLEDIQFKVRKKTEVIKGPLDFEIYDFHLKGISI